MTPASALLPRIVKWDEIDDEFYKHLYNIYDEEKNTVKASSRIENLKVCSIRRYDQ